MKNKEIIQKIINKKKTISVAESCTGGLIASEIVSVPNSSKVFNLGLITYSNNSKEKILKVKKKNLKKFGAVSPQVCKEMLDNLFKITKSDICVSTTGIAGPSGGTVLKPVGLIYVGLKLGNKSKIFMLNFKKKIHRNKIQKKTVNKVFSLIAKLI
tara:strand:- start:5956 stop:6423 length:468 start_codon:yes stop_codon:yes gene_type:complete